MFKVPEREHQAASQQEPDLVTERELPEASPAPTAVPPLSEFTEISFPQSAISPPQEVPVPSAEQLPPLRRSWRISRPPKTLSDYVLY